MAIVRAQAFYLPPPGQPATAWDLVPIAERVFKWYELKVHRRVPVPAGTVLGTQLWARIDAGRWIADCTCKSAQIISPDDPRYACPECGAGWYDLIFPEDIAAAEAAALAVSDAPSQQFWWNPQDPSPWNQQPTPPGDGGEEPPA